MHKELLVGDNTRKKLADGVRKLAEAVGATLGPEGNNVIFDRPGMAPLITNDGVTIARQIDLEDPYEKMGADVVKEAAVKTNRTAGDGTTTATVLTSAIMDAGLSAIDAGASPISLREELLKAAEDIVSRIEDVARPCDHQVAEIAAISSGSEEIGRLIQEAIDRVGRDGVISIGESRTVNTELEVVEGMEFTKGYISPYMVTDSVKMVASYEKVFVMTTDYKIENFNDIVPLMEQVVEKNSPLLIIADGYSDQVLSTLVMNKMRAGARIVAVTLPGFGDRRKAIAGDIAVMTGGSFITSDTNDRLQDVRLEHLGAAEKVVITGSSTTIVGGMGKDEDIEERCSALRAQIEDEEDMFLKEQLQKRLGKLTGGVAVIKIGAATETEAEEKELRLEDALNATKAALAEGIVPGGGSTYLHIAKTMPTDTRGAEVLKEALMHPFYLICSNAGINLDQTSEMIDFIDSAERGFNAKSKKMSEDMFADGVVDPAKVTKNALKNAVSVASTLLTTRVAAVTQLDDKDFLDRR